MTDSTASGNFIELTAEIVSAYVSNNTVPAGEIPGLINQVHAALARVSGKPAEGSAEPLKPAFRSRNQLPPIHRLSRRRQEIQIAEAAFAYPIQHDARAVSREMGSECRLPDGRAKLCGRSLATGETNGAWAAAPPARQVDALLLVAFRSAHKGINSLNSSLGKHLAMPAFTRTLDTV